MCDPMNMSLYSQKGKVEPVETWVNARSKCMVATGIGVVDGSSVVCWLPEEPIKSKDRARRCNACPKRNTKIKKLEKDGPIFPMY